MREKSSGHQCAVQSNLDDLCPGLFRLFLQALQGHRIFPKVDAAVLLERVNKPANQRIIPVIATQVSISGTLQAPRRIMRSTVSSWQVFASWKCVWMPFGWLGRPTA